MFTTLSKKVKPSLQEETLSVAEDSYSLTTKIQASLSLFAFLFSLLFAGSIASQEVIPQLQMEAYNSNLMNQVYGQSYFLNSLSAWTDQVTYYKGVLRAYWEAAADDAIYNYVDSITTSDAFNSVDAYKDYVFKELDSQKIAALNIWENQANLQLLENRNEFVLKLNTDRVDQSYLSRLGIQGTFNQPQDPNASTQELQRQIASAANNWNTNFNQSYQAGLNDFANSLNTIQNKYDSFLQSMNDSEATFTDNLSAINSYKTVVKDAIRGMVGQFQGMIDQPCNQATSCLYRDGNNGGLNTAGQTLNDLVARLNTVLNNQNLDSSNVLTTISSEINSFLSNQTNAARLTQIDYSNQVTTTQTSLNPPSTYGLGNVSSLITAVNNGTLSFYDLQSSQTSQWRVDTSGIFSGIVDPFIETMIRSITNGNSANIKGIIESQIGGGRTATVLATNVYTDWNGGSNGDGWAYFRALNTEMNLNRDGAATWNWGAERFIVSPPAYWINWFQMGRIGYQVVYEMYDPNAQALATYWNGNYTSLNGQLAQYQNNITPAIGNWESQVASYNSFYEQWKTSADALKAQAQADYENSMADLESKKSAWLNQMEAERNAGLNQWDQLYSNASSSGGQNAQSVASSIQAVNSSVSSGINIATGTQSILDNYNNKLDTLASTEFTFTDTTKRYEPALADTGIQKQLDPFAQIGNLGADYSIGNITKGELGNKLAFSGGIKQAFNDISDSTIRYGIGASTGGFSNGTFGSLQQAAFNSTGITPKNTDVAGGETSFTTQKFSILGAANEKKIDTSLSVDGKDLTEVFGKTANGVYQYSQLLSLNENNSSAAKAEQEKAVNQMAYQVNWDSKWSAKLDETGSLKLNGTIGNLSNQEVTDILKKLSTYEYKGLKFDQFCIAGTTDYAACQAEEQRMSKLQSDDYKAKFQSDIDKLAAQGYEIQNGMIVKSLSREDKIRLGQTEGLTLTDTEKQTASVCYVDPSKCKDLLKQEFTISYDKTGGVTLSKIISNGSIGGTNNAGQYISGTQTESRYISLSKVAPVVAPKGTDLFAEWGQDVWNDIDTQASQVMNDFYTKSLAQDSKMLTQATSVIRDVESKNEKLFQQKKAVQEETDEMIKELVMAYISGGMAGVTASIKSQIEDKINSGLAEAFIRGTGGSEADIQKVADLISLVRGRMQADKMKKRANTMSISNPIRSLENMVSKSFSTVMEVANNVTFGAAGAVLAVGTGIVTKVAGVVSDTIGSVTRALGPLGNTIGAILSPTTMLAAEATKKAADYIGEQSEKMLGAKNAMSEIKANEESIIKNYASQAIAKSTGLPPEVANNLVNDYVGSQKAKKARRAVNANPLANIGSQVVGAVGGIIKTAAVAFGAKERDIQEMLSDGNKILYSGNLDVTADELRNEAYTNQMFGMKLGALSYTSSTPKDKEGIVEELGQRMVVDQLAAATGWDKDVTNALFRKEYGRIKQKKADKKAQNAAIKSTAITAVTTALTLGAAGALGSAMQGAMNAVGGIVGGGANVGAAIIKGAIQVVDGARNGWEGALAGAANGALGVMGASGAFDIGSSFTSSLGSTASSFLQNSAVGLGVSYDKQNGWGGMIGIGGGTANASISFSQRGDTTISGSMNISGVKGLQVTASTTTNGATSIGVNYNAGKGPREGWNLGANYDINGGGFSGSIGYTNPGTGLGLTSTIDRNGLSTSSQINGVNIATNGPDGFNMDEMNWAEQNINLAQDRTDKLKESGTLRKAGYSQEQIDAMSDTDRAELAEIAETEQTLLGLKDKEGKPYTQERLDKMSAEEMGKLANEQTPQPIDIEAITGTALASLAAGAIAFVGLGGNGSSNGSESTPRVTEVVARRKEDEEGGGDKPEDDSDSTQDYRLTKEEKELYGKLQELAYENKLTPKQEALYKQFEIIRYNANPEIADNGTSGVTADRNAAREASEQIKKLMKEGDVKTPKKKLAVETKKEETTVVKKPKKDKVTGEPNLKDKFLKAIGDGLNTTGRFIEALVAPGLSAQEIPKGSSGLHPETERILSQTDSGKKYLKDKIDATAKIAEIKSTEEYKKLRAQKPELLTKQFDLHREIDKKLSDGYKESDAEIKALRATLAKTESNLKTVTAQLNPKELKAAENKLAKANAGIDAQISEYKTQLNSATAKDGTVVFKKTDYGVTSESLKAKQAIVEKMLVGETNANKLKSVRSIIENNNKLISDIDRILGSVKTDTDVMRYMDNPALIDKILSDVTVPSQARTYFIMLKDAMVRSGIEGKNQSSITDNSDSQMIRENAIKTVITELKADKESMVKWLEIKQNEARAKSNETLNRVIIDNNQSHNPDQLDKTQASIALKAVLNNKELFDNYVAQNVSSRKDIFDQRLDLADRKSKLEADLQASNLTKEQKASIRKEIGQLEVKSKALDKNISTNVIMMKEGESVANYLIRMKDDAVTELNAISDTKERIHKEIIEALSKTPLNAAKLEQLDSMSKSLEAREAKVKFLSERLNNINVAEVSKYLSNAKRELTLPDGVINPAGTGRTITYNSSFGWDGYGRGHDIYEYVTGNPHKGVDIGGRIGDPIRSITDGTIIDSTKGQSIYIPSSQKLLNAGVVYLNAETDTAGFYDSKGNRLSNEKLLEIDSEFKPTDFRKTGVQYKDGNFYRLEFQNNVKVSVNLSAAEVAMLPRELTTGDPKDIAKNFSSNGNSVKMKTIIDGQAYEVTYKHLDKLPSEKYTTAGNLITRNTTFGELGTTGSSTGAHLHLEVQTKNEPIGISKDYYEPMYGEDKKTIVGYLVNADYFLRELSAK